MSKTRSRRALHNPESEQRRAAQQVPGRRVDAYRARTQARASTDRWRAVETGRSIDLSATWPIL